MNSHQLKSRHLFHSCWLNEITRSLYVCQVGEYEQIKNSFVIVKCNCDVSVNRIHQRYLRETYIEKLA